MSFWSIRRFRKPAPDRTFRDASLSFSSRKLNQIVGEIKSRRKAFPGDRNIVVELMETAPISSFPLFPVSSVTAMPSGSESSAKSSLQSSLGNASSSSNAGQLSPPIEKQIVEKKATTSRFSAADNLRHVLTNPKIKQGAKLITLALLMLGFLCSSKAAALTITIAAYAIVRLGSMLGILDSSSSKPESANSRHGVRSDSLTRRISSHALHDQQELKDCTPDSIPYQRRLTPVRDQEQYIPGTEELKAECQPQRRLFLRSFTAPAGRKGFPSIMSRVISAGDASIQVNNRSKSLTRLGSLEHRESSSSAPISPSSVSRIDFASALYLGRPLCHESVFVTQETKPLSRVSSHQVSLTGRGQVPAGLKLGAILLLTLCGLRHGRVTAVFIASCIMLIFSKAQEYASPKKS